MAGLPQSATSQVEHTHDTCTRQRCVDFGAEATPPKLIFDVEDAELAARFQRIRYEVQHPDRIGMQGPFQWCPRADRTLAATAPAHLQALLAIQPVDLFQVHDHAPPPCHLAQPPVPEAPPLTRNLPEKGPLHIITLAFPFVPHSRTIHLEKPRGAALRQSVIGDHVPDRRVADTRRQKFFPTRSFNAALSSNCSASKVSRDGGVTWVQAAPAPEKLVALAASRSSADQVYAPTQNGLLLSMGDGGVRR